MQSMISEDKNTIRKLEASVTKAYSNVPSSVRTQNREIAQLSERVETAEATAYAANAVIDKYEREVFMLRAALDIHAQEFQDGSGQTVHASLVLALGQV
jgi:DNA-binding ferritin-like protein